MGKKRKFYPGPDDLLEGATDDEEMDSDRENDPVQSSDDSLWTESEDGGSESESDDAKSTVSDNGDKSYLVGAGNQLYEKYTRPVHRLPSEGAPRKRRRLQTDEQPQNNVASDADSNQTSSIPSNISPSSAVQSPVTQESTNTRNATRAAINSQSGEQREVLNMPAKPPKTRKDVLAKIAAGAEGFECPLCHLLMLSKASQERHVANHYKPKVEKPKHYCPRCGKEYKTKSAMNSHVDDSECWREWYPGPMQKDKSPTTFDLDDEGKPLEDYSNHNPAMLFSHFFHPLVERFKKHTNLAGAQIYTPSRAARFKRAVWNLLKKLELYKFITMFVAWGLIGFDRVRDPFKNDWLFHNPFFASWMSGNRFEQIVHATHFVDNEFETKPGRRGHPDSDNYDRLWRIRDVINEFCRISQRSWDPGRNLTIDEMMILFKGRWGHITLMPKKPIRKGIKLFAMSDARTGFVLNFIPSTGEHYPEYPILKKTGATIVALMRGDNLPDGWAKNYLHEGHYLFTDNYYTSFKTMEWLRRHGVYYCGTIRKDKRRVPEFMREAAHGNGRNFTRGEMKFAHSNTGLQLCTWLDNNTVIVASNIPDVTSGFGETERVISYKQGKKKVYLGKRWIPEPDVVWLYNTYMKGIDISDQLIAKCHHQFRTKKWFIPIWYQIIDMCVLNSFIIYKYYYKQKYPDAPQLTTPVYRRLLVESIRNHIEAVDPPKAKVPKRSKEPIVQAMPHEHFEIAKPLDVSKLKQRDKREIAEMRLDHTNYTHRLRECTRARCHVHIQEKSAYYMCSVCKVPMCVTPCHDRFHYSHFYKFNDPKLGKRKVNPKTIDHPFVVK